MKRIISLFIISIFLQAAIHAQEFELEDPVKIIPPSPTASSLGSYGGVNVGMHTGTLSTSIDLYTLKTKYLTIPIALNYSSNGVKVDQIASWVGLSWSLDVSGVITRTVMDKPDEYFRPSLPFVQGGLTFEVAEFLDDIFDKSYDVQPDVYSFSIPGRTGKFVYSEEGDPLIMPAQPISIEQPLASQNEFIIKTPDGASYFFERDDYEVTRNYASGAGCNSKFSFTPPQITAWYLSKIKHPKGDSIEFIYENHSFSYSTGISQRITRHVATSENNCSGMNPEEIDDKVCVQNLNVSGKHLKEIRTAGYGTVKFEVGARPDNPGDVRLDSIIISDYDNNVFKRIHLEYLITDEGYSSELYKRMFLKGVKEYGKGNHTYKEHKLLYDNPEVLPPRLSYSQDYWGYYNGANNNYFVPSTTAYNNVFAGIGGNRSVDTTKAGKGLLKEIIYPTGGRSVFEYEPNSSYGSKEIQNTDSYNFDLLNNNPWTQRDTGTFYLPAKGWVTISAGVTPCASCPEEEQDRAQTSASIVDQQGNSVYLCNTEDGESCLEELWLDSGYYSYSIIVRSGYGNLGVTYPLKPYYVPENIPTGGMRIRKVSTYDNVNEAPQIKKYYYNIFSEKNESFGKGINTPHHMSEMLIKKCCGATGNIYKYAVLSSNSNVPLYSTGSNNIYYPYVTVSHGENFENGGIEYSYKINEDIAGYMITPSASTLASAPRTNAGFDNGLLKKERIFKVVDSLDITLKETVNFYSSIKEPAEVRGLFVNKLFEYCGWTVTQSYKICQAHELDDQYESSWKSVNIFGGKTLVPYGSLLKGFGVQPDLVIDGVCFGKEEGDTIDYRHDFVGNIEALEYKHISNWNILDSTITTIYDMNGGNPSSTTNYFTYDSLIQQPIKVVAGIGNQLYKVNETSFITEYLNTGDSICYKAYANSLEISDNLYTDCYDHCQTSHSGNHEQLVDCINSCRTDRSLREESHSETLDNCLASGDSNYQNILFMKNNFIITPTIEQRSYLLDESGDTTYTDAIINLYEVSPGSLLNKKSVHRMQINNNNFIPAYIDNNRNFVYSENYEEAVTFNKYDEHGNLLEFKTISGVVTSIIWGYNNNFPVAKVEGLSYAELEAISELDLDFINQNYYSDEVLRAELLPLLEISTAMVSYMTYDPAYGITTQTDPNGKVTYYEYDDLGRLKMIKDDEFKLLKRIEYNYKN